jgi:hypothetical protein
MWFMEWTIDEEIPGFGDLSGYTVQGDGAVPAEFQRIHKKETMAVLVYPLSSSFV